MISTSYETKDLLPKKTDAKDYLPNLTNPQLEKITLEFLKGAECASLSTSCRRLYDRFQYSNANNKLISLWRKLFQRDFPHLALKADKILTAKIFAKQIVANDVYEIASQFYRSRVVLPLSHCTKLQGHYNTHRPFIVLANRQMASSHQYNNKIHLWSEYDTNPLVLQGHTDTVANILALQNGGIASWAADATVRLWNKEGVETAVLKGHTKAIWCVIELPNAILASGAEDHTIRLWTASGENVAVLRGHKAGITYLLALPNGQLASASHDATIRIWNEDGECINILKGHSEFIYRLLVLSDGTLISAANDLRLWNLNNAGMHRILYPGKAIYVKLLPDGRLVWTAEDNPIICVFSQVDELIVLKGHTGMVTCFAMLRNGILASGSVDNTIRLWSRKGENVKVLKDHNERVWWIDVLSDGRWVSAAEDAVFTRNSDGKKIGELPRNKTHKPYLLASIPDGRLALSQFQNSSYVWDVDPTELVTEAIKRAKYMDARGYRERFCSLM